MAQLIDLTDQVFGYLTVIKRDTSRKNKTYWICRCQCGKEVSVLSYYLRTGHTKSCGCMTHKMGADKHREDITGQHFGYLTAIKWDEERSKNYGRTYWIYKCICGKEISLLKDNVKRGKVKSCGCKSVELTRTSTMQHLEGKKFGDLTVIEECGSSSQGILWRCLCSCGKERIVATRYLNSGQTTHCGCKRIISRGEEKIKEILIRNNIEFEQQKTFSDLINKGHLFFDFYLPENNIVIEYQGEQHYESQPFFGGIEYLHTLQENDQFKRDYCKSHQLVLIEICYKDFNKLNDEYLLNLLKCKGEYNVQG